MEISYEFGFWQQTNNDPTLSKVRRFVQNGWPAQLPEIKKLQPFNHQRHELTVEVSHKEAEW